jgi:hypothetical protein
MCTLALSLSLCLVFISIKPQVAATAQSLSKVSVGSQIKLDFPSLHASEVKRAISDETHMETVLNEKTDESETSSEDFDETLVGKKLTRKRSYTSPTLVVQEFLNNAVTNAMVGKQRKERYEVADEAPVPSRDEEESDDDSFLFPPADGEPTATSANATSHNRSHSLDFFDLPPGFSSEPRSATASPTTPRASLHKQRSSSGTAGGGGGGGGGGDDSSSASASGTSSSRKNARAARATDRMAMSMGSESPPSAKSRADGSRQRRSNKQARAELAGTPGGAAARSSASKMCLSELASDKPRNTRHRDLIANEGRLRISSSCPEPALLIGETVEMSRSQSVDGVDLLEGTAGEQAVDLRLPLVANDELPSSGEEAFVSPRSRAKKSRKRRKDKYNASMEAIPMTSSSASSALASLTESSRKRSSSKDKDKDKDVAIPKRRHGSSEIPSTCTSTAISPPNSARGPQRDKYITGIREFIETAVGSHALGHTRRPSNSSSSNNSSGCSTGGSRMASEDASDLVAPLPNLTAVARSQSSSTASTDSQAEAPTARTPRGTVLGIAKKFETLLS